jgi:antitoxin PrlF
MSDVLKAESTLTDRYQTTVPETVRRALRLGKKDKIQYTITAKGEVILSRAENAEGEDPVLSQFLHFLAQDIANSPERLKAVDAGLVKRLRLLAEDVEIDLDSPLPEDDE